MPKITKTTNKKVDQGKQTHQTLVKTARSLFSGKGYEKTSTEEVVKEANVTRGALYHHFKGKRELFKAVFDDVHVDIADGIIKGTRREAGLWNRLLKGTYTFLDLCLEPGTQRIVLIDGPAVLGWQEWREIDNQRSMIYLRNILRDLIVEQGINDLPLEPTVHLVSGATNEMALWIAQAEDPKTAHRQARLTLKLLFEKLLLTKG